MNKLSSALKGATGLDKQRSETVLRRAQGSSAVSEVQYRFDQELYSTQVNSVPLKTATTKKFVASELPGQSTLTIV